VIFSPKYMTDATFIGLLLYLLVLVALSGGEGDRSLSPLEGGVGETLLAGERDSFRLA